MITKRSERMQAQFSVIFLLRSLTPHSVIHLPLCPSPQTHSAFWQKFSVYDMVCASPWYPHLVHAGVSRTSCESRHWWLWHSTNLCATHNYNHGVLIYVYQRREKLQCLYKNLMSNNFPWTAVLKKMWILN